MIISLVTLGGGGEGRRGGLTPSDGDQSISMNFKLSLAAFVIEIREG